MEKAFDAKKPIKKYNEQNNKGGDLKVAKKVVKKTAKKPVKKAKKGCCK
ncbi:MAG: hypothetical protein ABIK20_02335 [Candidatus Omnitrophota bacterium]|nr:hypothetical protein [Candidatus Omnitrophota bacterium]